MDIDKINSLYITEKNLLKSSVNKLLESSNEIIHDNILAIFDNIDEINRRLYRYLKDNKIIKETYVNKNKKDYLYEELDSLLLRINE